MPNSSDTGKFASRQWLYPFRVLKQKLPESRCDQVTQRLLRRYASQAESWSIELNSEWLCRAYFAAKLVMSANLHLSALEYAEGRNLRVVAPYLRYYSLLSTFRAVHLLLPETPWNRGQVIKATHAVVIREVVQFVSTLDKNIAENLRTQTRALKAARELVSYRAPTSGDRSIAVDTLLIETCTLLCELAQYLSELLQTSVEKHADPSTFGLKPDHLQELAFVEIDGVMFADWDDASRLGKFGRGEQHPYSIWLMMSEGHVDDFFGTWAASDELEGSFDPDHDQQIIFNIP